MTAIRVFLSSHLSAISFRLSHNIRCFSSSNKSLAHDIIENLSSERARQSVQLLPTYLSDARSVTKYHPLESPDGALQLSVAENLMLEDLLVPWVHHFSYSDNTSSVNLNHETGSFEANQIYYQPTHGRLGLRNAMAAYLTRLLNLETRQDSDKSSRTLDVNGLIIGAGCNAVLENLCFCLTEPGDAVLIPTPYYAAFDFDLGARIGLKLIPVSPVSTNISPETGAHISPLQYYPNRSSLDAAYAHAQSSGHEPKVLLLSHPNNPLGVCYPPSVLIECVEWARDRKVHLISDEIYAGSVYRSNTDGRENKVSGPFQSILHVAATQKNSASSLGLGLGPYIHFVYALSKDFALSGLRVGVAYTENESIRLPMQKLNDLCQVSSQTQSTVERMLNACNVFSGSDGREKKSYWSTDIFLEESRKRIKDRCDKLQYCLEQNRIPYIPADSGMFVWMDFSEFLPISATLDDDMKERELYLELLRHGLLFTPGRSMKNFSPGFFRCVFTAATDIEFNLALHRIATFIQFKR